MLASRSMTPSRSSGKKGRVSAVAVPHIADAIGYTGTVADCVPAEVRFCIRGSILPHMLRPQFVHGVLDPPGEPKKYLHDLISSDRRYPTVNANGRLFGSPEYSTDPLPILDPKTHTVTYFRAPVFPPGDHDVALDAFGPLGLAMRQLALGDPIGPVGEILERRSA